MVEVPKPAFLIRTSGTASDEFLALTPAVREAWIARVMAFRRGEVPGGHNEDELPTSSILDEVASLWRRKVLGKDKGGNVRRPFDHGAVVMGDKPMIEAAKSVARGSSSDGSDGGGDGGLQCAEGCEELAGGDKATEQQAGAKGPEEHPEHKEGTCVICFAENPA